MKKKLINTFLPVLLLLIPTCMWAGNNNKRIVVHNGLEFIKALGSDRTIVIAKGAEINLTDEILNGKPEELGIKDIEISINSSADTKNGVLTYQNVYDGKELHISYMKNLTIEGEGDTRSIIKVRPRYSYIFSFDNCKDITLRNLELGHTDGGYCLGGVLNFINTKGIRIESCDLYGCGTEGITATDCMNLDCYYSIIRDCSYSIMTIKNVKGQLNFVECQFLRNKEYSLINGDKNCDPMHFTNCVFKDNDGLLFTVENPGILDNCTFQHEGNLGNIDDFQNIGSTISNSSENESVSDDIPANWKKYAFDEEGVAPFEYHLLQGEYMGQQLRIALCNRLNLFIGEALLGKDQAYPITVRGLKDNDGELTLYFQNTDFPYIVDIELIGKMTDNGFEGMDITTLKKVKLKKVKTKTPYAIDRNKLGYASPWHKDNRMNFDSFTHKNFAGIYMYNGPLNKEGKYDIMRGIDGNINLFKAEITIKSGAYTYENAVTSQLINDQLFLQFRDRNGETKYVLRLRFYEGFIIVTRVEGSPEGIIPANIKLEGIFFELPSMG